MAEAKAKIKKRHEDGIAGYRAWLDQNPNATHDEKVQNFELMMATAELNKKLHAA